MTPKNETYSPFCWNRLLSIAIIIYYIIWRTWQPVKTATPINHAKDYILSPCSQYFFLLPLVPCCNNNNFFSSVLSFSTDMMCILTATNRTGLCLFSCYLFNLFYIYTLWKIWAIFFDHLPNVVPIVNPTIYWAIFCPVVLVKVSTLLHTCIIVSYFDQHLGKDMTFQLPDYGSPLVGKILTSCWAIGKNIAQ